MVHDHPLKYDSMKTDIHLLYNVQKNFTVTLETLYHNLMISHTKGEKNHMYITLNHMYITLKNVWPI